MTPRLRGLCRVVELFKVSCWAPNAEAFRLLISWEDANVFNDGSWRIGNDFTSFCVLYPSYKWRFCCSVTHILKILLFLVCRSNLRGMKLRGLVVFAGGSPEDSSSALLDLCLWELCFSLVVSPLWELCYSLASC